MTRQATTAIFVALCLGMAAGHGLVTKPMMRTAKAGGGTATACPQCLNAGGTSKMSNYGSITYTDVFPSTALHGICGDPQESNFNNGAGTKDGNSYPVTEMSVGADGTFTIETVLTSNHWGKICYRVFTDPADVAAGNEAAAKELLRADGKGNCVYPPISDRSDGDGMRYVGPATSEDWSASISGDKYASEYIWPSDLSCNGRCVLHMHWTTGHICNPPGVPASSQKDSSMATCGQGGGYPEQFWNCADMRMSSSSSSQQGRRLLQK